VTFVKNGNSVTVNGASVGTPNILASNGVLHILNSVLLPSNFVFTLLNGLEGALSFTIHTRSLTIHSHTHHSL